MTRKGAQKDSKAQAAAGRRKAPPKPGSAASKPARAAPVRRGRQPRDAFRRMHLSIAEELADYLEVAWRTHRRPDGALARTASQFVEDLIAAHRAKAGTRRGAAG